MKLKRKLAYPLAIGTEVRMLGRIKECAELIQPGQRLLDIGCSSGWLARIVLEKGFRMYVGVDRAIVRSERLDGPVQFVEGSVFTLPFDSGSFDAACLFDVIEHLPRGSEEMALRQVHRVLTPGGKLYFSTPHASPLHTPLDPVWVLGHRQYRRTTVLRFLRSAGFTPDRLFVAGGLVECLDHIRLLGYKHLLHRPQPAIDFISKQIERSHGGDRALGMTVFAIASR